jgi:hypothetical protein
VNLRIDYATYLASEHWRQVRAETLRLAGHHCILCGHGDRGLESHHTDEGYGNLGSERPGIDTRCLCRQCHEELSVGREVLAGAPAQKGSLKVRCGAPLARENGEGMADSPTERKVQLEGAE